MPTGTYKSENGKLVRVRFETISIGNTKSKVSLKSKESIKNKEGLNKPEKIKSAEISGDFFLSPEEKITLLEKTLAGVMLDKSEIIKAVNDCVKKENITLVGISPEDIAEAILGPTTV